MAVSMPSNQVNDGKKPMGAKRVKMGGLLRSLSFDVFHHSSPSPFSPTKQTFRKKNQVANLMLISINVQESTGPLRFLVRVDDTVGSVIDTALRSYAREGRLPVLGTNFNNFYLHCANSEFKALSPVEPIGMHGGRNFVLCKKQQQEHIDEEHQQQGRRGGMLKRHWKLFSQNGN
ncbi:hypothetical protein AMTR_s00130p00016510 [Amborella trichopoda]|uniref:DUF7054 domain-containing protein n=1 Tax=Amborella trichopoda TaxID=13333 RepID=W1NRH3_AMBTC|nr:hypothetical protein AMTR_s00130p00016510 [Amborella trichopoda]